MTLQEPTLCIGGYNVSGPPYFPSVFSPSQRPAPPRGYTEYKKPKHRVLIKEGVKHYSKAGIDLNSRFRHICP